MRGAWLLVMAALLVNLSGCGTKGKLKSPTQAQIAAEKKAKREHDRDNKDAQTTDDGRPVIVTDSFNSLPSNGAPAAIPPTVPGSAADVGIK